MCLATLSIKAGKREHAVPLALPHTRGFISLTEQQPLETANQHAVSKGRLRWQLRARAMRSACCHLVILFTAGGAASQLAGRHVCQQTLSPLMLRHIHGGGVRNELIPVWCFSSAYPTLAPCSPLSRSPLPQLMKKVKTTTNKPRVFSLFLEVLLVGGIFFIQSSLKNEAAACVPYRQGEVNWPGNCPDVQSYALSQANLGFCLLVYSE